MKQVIKIMYLYFVVQPIAVRSVRAICCTVLPGISQSHPEVTETIMT